jgi:hypothetical protein
MLYEVGFWPDQEEFRSNIRTCSLLKMHSGDKIGRAIRNLEYRALR